MDLSWIKDHLGRGLILALGMVALVLVANSLDKPYAWIVGVCIAVAILGVLFFYERRPFNRKLESKEWFSLIRQHLEDASSVQIYLRGFKHPDDFHDEHRGSLLAIMRAFVQHIVEHPDTFRIVAYRNSSNASKDAAHWIQNELERLKGVEEGARLAAACIRVIDKQPYPNSSTVYLIDHEVVIYNYVEDGQEATYHALKLGRSVIPRLISDGILKLFQTG